MNRYKLLDLGGVNMMKNKTNTIIAEKRDYYTKMATMCNEMLDGKSMSKVCKENNISVQCFRGRIFKNDTKISSYNQEELLKIAESHLGPEERILRDILESFNVRFKPLILFKFPKDFEETVRKIMDEVLDSRMQLVIEMYYYEDKTLEEIGKFLKISSSRVGQYLHRARRALSRKNNLFRMIYGDTEYYNQCSLASIDDAQSLMDEISKAMYFSTSIEELCNRIQSHVRKFQADYQRMKKENIPEGVHIDKLGLDTRTYNSIMRETDIRAIDQLANMTDKELLTIPNFGKKCLEDVKECLKKYYETINPS